MFAILYGNHLSVFFICSLVQWTRKLKQALSQRKHLVYERGGITLSKIKVGVIGVGQMGTYHAQIYQKLPQVELMALCEFNDQRS